MDLRHGSPVADASRVSTDRSSVLLRALWLEVRALGQRTPQHTSERIDKHTTGEDNPAMRRANVNT